MYSQMLEQFYWECENRPDHRHSPEVERILSDDPFFEKPENLTPEKIQENLEWWEEFTKSPVIKFLRRAEVIADKFNEMELKENEHPYRWEDRKLWKDLPYVPGLDGRPMPRKAIKTKKESDDKFWDFARQFFFGLWGFRQRPYPSSRPIDVAQAIGYKNLERRYYDCELFLLPPISDLDSILLIGSLSLLEGINAYKHEELGTKGVVAITLQHH